MIDDDGCDLNVEDCRWSDNVDDDNDWDDGDDGGDGDDADDATETGRHRHGTADGLGPLVTNQSFDFSQCTRLRMVKNLPSKVFNQNW